MDGGVAQLGEHLPCKQGVMGSIPIISTTGQARTQQSGEASAMRHCNPRESRSDESREGKGKMVKLEGKKPSRFCRDGTNEENQMRNGL